MKALLSLVAVPFMLVATASADWVIETKVESPQLNTNMTAKVKGNQLRVDIPDSPAGAMSSIIDTTTGNSIQILHAQKMAMTTTGAQLKQAIDAAKAQTGAKGTTSTPPTATGQKEKVGDYNCEIYTWSDGGTSARLWVTKDHPQAAALKALEKQMKSGPFGNQGGPDTSSLPGVAVKTEVTAQGQKMTTTIGSVKEQALDDKDFKVPDGYQTMAMPTLPSGK